MKSALKTRAAVILVIGILLVAGTSLARSRFIPMSGQDATTIIDPGVVWTDDDGVTHIRGMKATSIMTGEDIDGVPITGAGDYTVDVDLNYTTGDGEMTAKGMLAMGYGDRVGSWKIRFNTTITGFVHDGTFKAPRGFGDFRRWHLRGTWTGVYSSGEPHLFDGVFHIPGHHGDKAAPVELKTLSAVKGLFL